MAKRGRQLKDGLRFHRATGRYYRVYDGSCFVTQQGRGVAVIRKGETEPQTILSPPDSWGNSWVWNVLEDGSGIYFKQSPSLKGAS